MLSLSLGIDLWMKLVRGWFPWNFSGNCKTAFQRSCTILHYCQDELVNFSLLQLKMWEKLLLKEEGVFQLMGLEVCGSRFRGSIHLVSDSGTRAEEASQGEPGSREWASTITPVVSPYKATVILPQGLHTNNLTQSNESNNFPKPLCSDSIIKVSTLLAPINVRIWVLKTKPCLSYSTIASNFSIP